MDKLVIGFNGGEKPVDKVVKLFSDSEKLNITHSFVIILNSTFESKGIKDPGDPYPGVWLHPPDKYINDPTARFIEIEIPSLEEAENRARYLLGKFYGYSSCFAFFLRKINKAIYKSLSKAHPKLKPILQSIIDFFRIPDISLSCNCSEAQSDVIRDPHLHMLIKYQANEIAPLMVYLWAIKNGGVDVTERYHKKEVAL